MSTESEKEKIENRVKSVDPFKSKVHFSMQICQEAHTFVRHLSTGKDYFYFLILHSIVARDEIVTARKKIGLYKLCLYVWTKGINIVCPAVSCLAAVYIYILRRRVSLCEKKPFKV